MEAFAALFDPLYCPEEHLDLYHEEPAEEQWPDQQQPRPAALDDELPALFEAFRAREGVVLAADGEEGGYGGAAGREAAVGWASGAAARLGFSALTAALAAAYLDRCFLPGGALRLGDQPWMARLAAVACVALAGKVEETRVPLLLDLQLCAAAGADPADAYVFEAKTLRRMELLVLSALDWRMHPVTPFSYLQPLLADAAMRLHNCEGVLLAVITDWRWPRYRPSAWASAALLATAGSGDDDAELLALIDVCVLHRKELAPTSKQLLFLAQQSAGLASFSPSYEMHSINNKSIACTTEASFPPFFSIKSAPAAAAPFVPIASQSNL